MTQQKVADWYNRRYQSEGENAFGRPPKEANDRLNKMNLTNCDNMSLLDIGAGQGYFVDSAQKMGMKAVGIDIAHTGSIIAKNTVENGLFATADGHRLPFATGSFDIVTYWGTLEHHINMNLALQEGRRVLKRDGIAVFRVPNINFWMYRLMAIAGANIGTEQQDIVEHLLNYDEWQQIFNEHSFSVHSVTPDDWFLRAEFTKSHGLYQNLKMLLRKFSISVAPLRSTYSFDFICKAV